jgi:hypothetical protein
MKNISDGIKEHSKKLDFLQYADTLKTELKSMNANIKTANAHLELLNNNINEIKFLIFIVSTTAIFVLILKLFF